MKTLILLRHAKSGWDDLVARDFDRPLNAKGQRAAFAVGQHARSIGLVFDAAVASPAKRVEETLEQFERGYGSAVAPVWDQRLYLASVASLIDVIRELPAGADTVLIAGHNPGLEELVLMLVPDEPNTARDAVEEKFPTASVAELSFAVESWDLIRSGKAELRRFVRPRDLDPSLGPSRD